MKTDTVIRVEGMNALISQLGYVDAERFIMLMTRESFDYTKWREENLDWNISVRQLSELAKEYHAE